MAKKAHILVIDKGKAFAQRLLDMSGGEDLEITTVPDVQAAQKELGRQASQLILADLDTLGPDHTTWGIATLKSLSPGSTTMVVSRPNAMEDLTRRAMQAGADGVLYEPFQLDSIVAMVSRAGLAEVELAEPEVHPAGVDLRSYTIDPHVLAMIPESMARKYTLLPIGVEGNSLTVAMANPLNLQAMEDIWVLTRKRVVPVSAPAEDITAAINLHYRSRIEIERQIELLSPTSRPEETPTAARPATLVVDTPIVRTVDLLVAQAVKDGVSDIHITPQEDHLRIRYRVDGILHDTMSLPLSVHGPLISRIKIMADMNIAERRRFQDGTFSLKVDGNTVDIRAATANTTWGEMAVLRVLDKSMTVLTLADIGFTPEALVTYKQLLSSPFGMVLVSGPTGSGKTTTLYASINQMDRKGRNVMTIEDPVEYHFRDINQIQVNRLADITFASGLRATMRLDPDVILVGEIRDRETADTAVQAALTGHLVLSSVHANDAVGVLFRLMDLGVPPFLLNSAVMGIIGQRLVRRVHNECRHLASASPEAQQAFTQVTGEHQETFYYGAGCPFCSFTGYKGRTAVFEILVMSEQIRQMLIASAPADKIKAQAIAEGMVPLIQDGMRKAKEGITTPDEVIRHVFTII